jgi:arginase
MTRQHGSGRPVMFGAPMNAGAGRRGAEMGPKALRVAGLAQRLAALGHVVTDRGNLVPGAVTPAGLSAHLAHNLPEVAGWVAAIRAETASILAAGGLPVLLGGDHSVSIGSVAAVAEEARRQGRELFTLWIDAHADYNTPATSPSGNVHGMALAALCGEPGLGPLGTCAPPPLSPGHVHLFGVRDVDPGEQALLAARGIDVVRMETIVAGGVAPPLARILDRVAERDGMLHVSFDIDALDPMLAPGVGTPVPGGLGAADAREMMAMLHASCHLSALDVVELNPLLDVRGRTVRHVVDLLAVLFGCRAVSRRSA